MYITNLDSLAACYEPGMLFLLMQFTKTLFHADSFHILFCLGSFISAALIPDWSLTFGVQTSGSGNI
jgi:hypothetical protein